MESQTKSEETPESDEKGDYLCGVGSWRPQWLQRFASPRAFLVNYSLVAIVQGASFTYLIGSITTLERRYGFDSKISGLILIADNFSQMIINPFIGYLGTKYNRPMIMAIGELIVALSCFMFSVPYFIYGENKSFDINVSKVSSQTQFCDPNRESDCTEVTVWPAVITLWSASFVNGIGYTAFYTVGLPYMDDNTSKKNSPMYLSLSGSLRLLGPSMGFLLSSLCLKYYENPLIDPGFDNQDARWIGAWWIGFIVIGVLLIFTSLPMIVFPTHMTSKAIKEVTKEEEVNKTSNKSEMRQSMDTLIRIFKNPIFMFNLFGMCLRVLGYLGYYLFKPKYMEAQFGMTSSNANMWTGLVSIPPMAIGIMAGGIFLAKFKPGARKVVIFIFTIDMITNLAILSLMFLKCDHPQFATSIQNSSESLCFDDCKCTKTIFKPICANDIVYLNHCFAGCSTAPTKDWNDCKCIDDSKTAVVDGYCGKSCHLFPIYLTILGIASIVMSTAKVGDTLIVLRCVEPRDKNFAMAIIGSFLAVLTFIPYPPLFGWITDLACIEWKTSCNKTGNCLRYDTEKFRYYLHLSAFTIIMIGTLFLIPVIFYANRIKDMFEDNQTEDKLYELGSVNEGFDPSLDTSNNNNNNSIKVLKIITYLNENRRKSSIKDYELVHRKNSFVAI